MIDSIRLAPRVEFGSSVVSTPSLRARRLEKTRATVGSSLGRAVLLGACVASAVASAAQGASADSPGHEVYATPECRFLLESPLVAYSDPEEELVDLGIGCGNALTDDASGALADSLFLEMIASRTRAGTFDADVMERMVRFLEPAGEERSPEGATRIDVRSLALEVQLLEERFRDGPPALRLRYADRLWRYVHARSFDDPTRDRPLDSAARADLMSAIEELARLARRNYSPPEGNGPDDVFSVMFVALDEAKIRYLDAGNESAAEAVRDVHRHMLARADSIDKVSLVRAMQYRVDAYNRSVAAGRADTNQGWLALNLANAGGFRRDLIDLYDYYSDEPKLPEEYIVQLGELVAVQAELIVAPEYIASGDWKVGFVRPMKRARYLRYSQFDGIRRRAASLEERAVAELEVEKRVRNRRQRERTVAGFAALSALFITALANSDSNGSGSDLSIERWEAEEAERKRRLNNDLHGAWAGVGTVW